jgi:hypothetical protein
LKSVRAKVAELEPLYGMRRIMPSLFPSEPVAVPGTSAEHRTEQDTQDTKDKHRRKKQKKQKHGAGSKSDAPGSKSDVAFWIEPQKRLFLGARVYNVADIAAHYKIKVEDKCWPVLLSFMPGQGKLALCGDLQAHGAKLDAAPHKPPAGFNLKHVVKNFSKQSTNEEKKQAGWTAPVFDRSASKS